MNVEDELSEIVEYKTYMKSFFEEIAEISMQDVAGITDGDNKSKIADFLSAKKGFSSNEVQSIMDIISVTSVSSLLNENQALAYEREFINLVDNSALSTENKMIVKTTGSVAIMSANYHGNVEE